MEFARKHYHQSVVMSEEKGEKDDYVTEAAGEGSCPTFWMIDDSITSLKNAVNGQQNLTEVPLADYIAHVEG